MEQWWIYSEKILICLKENIQYLRKERRILVNNLFSTKLLKEVVWGEGSKIDFGKIKKLTPELQNEAQSSFINAVNQLYEAVKKE
jgi:hypothetical protein